MTTAETQEENNKFSFGPSGLTCSTRKKPWATRLVALALHGYLVIKGYNEHANSSIMEKISIKICHEKNHSWSE